MMVAALLEGIVAITAAVLCCQAVCCCKSIPRVRTSMYLHLPVVTDSLILQALTFVKAGVFITIMAVTVFVVVCVIVLVFFVKRPNRGQWYEVQDGASRQDRHNHGGDDLKHRTTELAACRVSTAQQLLGQHGSADYTDEVVAQRKVR